MSTKKKPAIKPPVNKYALGTPKDPIFINPPGLEATEISEEEYAKRAFRRKRGERDALVRESGYLDKKIHDISSKQDKYEHRFNLVQKLINLIDEGENQ